MLRLSANLGFLWPDRPLLDRIDAAAAVGFRGIEMHWPYDVPATAVRDRCDRHGLTLLAVNTVRGSRPDDFGLGAVPGREREFQRAVDQALRFCVETGGRMVHCMAGRVEPGDAERARATFLANLRLASDKAARAEVTLLLEPINAIDAPGYFYHRARESAELIAALGRDNVRLMYDCYHAGRAGADVVAEIERDLPVIAHVQIAAVPTRTEPDTGELDYRAVLASLDRLGYLGWVGCEYRPATDTDAGLGWVERLGLAPWALSGPS